MQHDDISAAAEKEQSLHLNRQVQAVIRVTYLSFDYTRVFTVLKVCVEKKESVASSSNRYRADMLVCITHYKSLLSCGRPIDNLNIQILFMKKTQC